MIHYQYLLFDADNTLFDFDRANRGAFHAVCQAMDISESDEHFALYERCNNALWRAFDRGECTKDFLVIERFRRFLAQLDIERDPERCNAVHLQALSHSSFPLPYAEELCRTLSFTHRLYLVTNAVATVQRSRLRRSVLAPLTRMESSYSCTMVPVSRSFALMHSRCLGITFLTRTSPPVAAAATI